MECVICNKEIEKSEFTNAILCSALCYNNHFWEEKVRLHDEYTVIADGDRYHLTPSNSGAGWKGFGGATFYVHFHDGRKIQCSNVWHQGEVPPNFKERLPDNAKFIPMKDIEDPSIFINY